MGSCDDEVAIVDITKGSALPRYSDLAAVIITGSHSSVTEQLDWSQDIAAWIPGVLSRHIPILGICYGHQLMAHALGGRVADNPNGLEIGTVNMQLTKEAAQDRLLAGLTDPVKIIASHFQTVMELPDSAKVLATSKMDSHMVLAMADNAWGLQFHPEFNAAIVIEYIEFFRDSLIAQGKDPDKLIEASQDTPEAAGILTRFYEIVSD
jgi:GMP synthase (glutamine-hydrolysing)